tara:strand:+ start:47 stop:676 length:630 start_codon:yes stop_codon:yes gene_type:complete
MSILPEVPETLMKESNSRKLTDPSVLIATASRMIAKVSVEANAENRTRTLIARWHVSNLLSAIDEATWFNMVSATLDGQKKTLNNMQSNGSWQPCGFEAEIREFEGEAVLMLGVKWTDENGGDDVVYQNGAPVVNVNVTTKGDSSDDKAMTLEILKMLATGQVNTNEAIARLSGDTPSTEEEEVIQEPAPAVKPKTTNQKRSIGKRPTN